MIPDTTTEQTHTITVTENELARILGALQESAQSLQETSAELGGPESERGAYPALLAQAANDLRERLSLVLRPLDDGFVNHDERLRREALVDL